MTHPYLVETDHPRIFAHRGFVSAAESARGIAENTLASVSAAVEAGAHFVESDGHVTRDGHVVLFHDKNLQRVAGDARPVSEVRLNELQEIMADRGGVLTLPEALQLFEGVRFNLDVKAAAAAEPMGQLVAPHGHRVLLTSFSESHRRRALAAAASARRSSSVQMPATSASRAALVRVLFALQARSDLALRRAFDGFDALQIPERQGLLKVVTPRLLNAAHQEGVEVHVWTVNDPATMQRLVALGVDGIITDRTDLALETLAP